MGRRKFKLGRAHKCYEQKRQAAKKNPVGRPPKRCRNSTSPTSQPVSQETPQESQHIHSVEEEALTMDKLRQNLMLPSQWTLHDNDGIILVSKIMPYTQPIITHSVRVNTDLSWEAFVQGQRVTSSKSKLLAKFPDVLDIECLNSLITCLDMSTICPGHPDKNFVEMLSTMKGKISSRHGKETVAIIDSFAPVFLNGETYNQTVRHVQCEIITNTAKCTHCIQYRNSLRKSFHSWKKRNSTSPTRRTSTSSCTNFTLLNTPEKLQRYKNLKRRSLATERRLKDVMEKLTLKHGISLDEHMHNDFETIMHEMTEKVQQSHAEDSFRRIFWEQQLQAIHLNDRRQVRWHPSIIKWCLHLKFKSSSAYDALRSTGVLTLPSERTLRDYTHWMKGQVGFSSSLNQELIKEANVNEEKDKYVVLVFDEMKVREDLVFDKHSCRLIGFVNLGEINETLDKFERQCQNKEQVISEESVANHMLVFMIRGLFTSLEFVYAQFPTHGLTGESLFPIVWKTIRNIEECDLKVIVVTADGASPNRKFFKMHQTKKNDEVVYKTPNPYSQDDREVYFMSDVPHLIKTTRNCWSNSFMHKNTRSLWVSSNLCSICSCPCKMINVLICYTYLLYFH